MLLQNIMHPKKKLIYIIFLGTSLNELADMHLTKYNGGYICNLCNKLVRDKTDAKRHLESKHFQNEFIYECDICGKVLNTSMSLYCHKKSCQGSRDYVS